MQEHEVLFGEKAIGTRVREMFAGATGRRVVLSAFVGVSPKSYLGQDVSGISVYCWPHPIATRPEGLQSLFGRAKLYFVPNLHMKVYWVEGRGAIVGSANLSGSALDEGGLNEAAIYFPNENAVPINALIRSLSGVQEVTKARLLAFTARFKRHAARRGSQPKAAMAPLPSYEDWLKGGSLEKWRLLFYEFSDDVKPISDRAKREINELRGAAPSTNVEPFDEIAHLREDDFVEHEWVLVARINKTGTSIKSLSWFYPDYCVKDRYSYYRMVQLERQSPVRAPFDVKRSDLRSALTSRLDEIVDWAAITNTARLKRLFSSKIPS